MPISKVPLVHKFGIISLSKAEQIVRQQRYLEHSAKRNQFLNKSTSCPIITVDFINKYNASSECEKEQLNGVVRRVLEHAKYKSCRPSNLKGAISSSPFSHKGKGPLSLAVHQTDVGKENAIDVSEGWLELVMICQCCGPLQEESLLLLCRSLSSSSVSPSHIPVLFYISGLCYHWLKSGTSPSVLRSGELLLLKVLHKVSLRMYLHHLTSDLQDICSAAEIQQLRFDMEGFESCEKTYQNFPEALLHWRIAMEVGSLICDKYSGHISSTPIMSIPEEKEEGGKMSTGNTKTSTTITVMDSLSKSSSFFSDSHGGHSLSPILWHALDVWQCGQQDCSSLNEAIQDLISCSIDFSTQQWLEGLLAIEVLCDAAKINKDILLLVQSLAAGTIKNFQEGGSPKKSTKISSSDSRQPSLSNYRDELDEENNTISINMDSGSELFPNKTQDAKNVTTLNILGVQPTFMEVETESEYTTYTAEDEGEDENEEEGSSTRRTPGLSHTSVTTQALIDAESIPDTPMSTRSTEYASIPYLSTLDSFELSELKITSTTDGNQSGALDSQHVSVAKGSSGVLEEMEEESGWNETGLSGSEDLWPKKERKSSLQKKVTLVSLPITPEVSMSPLSDSGESALSSSSESRLHKSTIDRVGLLDDRFELIGVLKRRTNDNGPKSVTLALPAPHRPDSRCTHYTHSTAPFSWVGGRVLGSQAPPSTVYQQSILSLSQSIGSDEVLSASGDTVEVHYFNTWPIEIQLSYVLNMADIVVSGYDSDVQRTALVGPEDDATTRQYSLVHLSGYEKPSESKKILGVADSWYIRHCVTLGLTRVFQNCKHLPTQDGMSEIAWNTLQKRMSLETEAKVLEAHKLELSCPVDFTPSSRQPSSSLSVSSSPTLISHIAEQLANLFLPATTYATSMSTAKPKKSLPVHHKRDKIIDKSKIQPKVNTQRSPDSSKAKPDSYVTKTTFTLKRIAEKHWQLQMQREEEEERKTEKEEMKRKNGKLPKAQRK